MSDKYHLGRIEYKKKLHTKLEKLGLNLPPIGAPLDDSHIREILLEISDYTQTRRTLKVGLSTEGSTNKSLPVPYLNGFTTKRNHLIQNRIGRIYFLYQWRCTRSLRKMHLLPVILQRFPAMHQLPLNGMGRGIQLRKV